VSALAVLSMHTSPLTQPGTGDGGGMNVYVRELCAALARSGVRCEVFTRAERERGRGAAGDIVTVEPGFRVHHIGAGPVGPVVKEQLPELVAAWTAGVARRLRDLADRGEPVDAIHANYWLSGMAGHTLKHELDLPLVVTFHTLDRVKAEASQEELSAAEPLRRAAAEAEIVGCADAVLASCPVEADQLIGLYHADPARIALVAPGVDHAFFAPGDQDQARRAVGFAPHEPVALFAGRIQPLKGLTVAVEALARVRDSDGRRAQLVVIGGPSGPHGEEELGRVHELVGLLGLGSAVQLLPPQRHEMLSTYYRAADVCVVPSRSESFGLVALEAGACGIPVVAAGVGGLTTLIDHGRTGFLVDSRDPDDYARYLSRLLSDRVLATQIGAAAAAGARSYTWKAAAIRLRLRCEQLTSQVLVACR
jgi:D-inositol-3-phosphate glycosyltransferase